MEDAISHAKKFVEDILSFFGLNTDITATYDEDVIELSVASTHLNGFLIGQNGDTLRSLQSLTLSSLRQNGFEEYRLNLDIANYKKQQNEKVAEKAQKWSQSVLDSGKDMRLEFLNAAHRRVVHQAVADFGQGLSTESVGEGRDRRLVIKAANEE